MKEERLSTYLLKHGLAYLIILCLCIFVMRMTEKEEKERFDIERAEYRDILNRQRVEIDTLEEVIAKHLTSSKEEHIDGRV